MSAAGDRIRSLRRERRLSQHDIASPGVTYTYISRIEAGTRRPSVRALRTLATKLDASAYWLETGQDDPAQELARIVLDHRAGPLPRRARTLARSILRHPR